ncbi:pyridoxal phosphate-dependent aminotransferase [Flavobacterium psychroterrae]|uniref:cysteine-S-conjugate beta-lyase n=1 Tax=Flavobacterium psychroterrae TaxID=2133767 RepID=A0ABS5PCC7_9FLAO|nr:MalY/PatB family protein [Flavobacterium psychroterrae]MBS7231500.1 pyridoxal phosphate-dependent aminotransferase [Flavobacterium psychroterrae]
MKYNFDEIISRKDSGSIKWDEAPFGEVLPMWIADMDFKSAPEILKALQKRADHGIFGYTAIPEAFYAAIMKWWKRRYGFTLEKEWLVPVSGVIPALSAAIQSLSKTGDKVIIQSPVYNHFYSSIENSGRIAIENNLIYNNGEYIIDFEDLAQKAADPKVKLLIISNPHNPVGRVWKKEELQAVGDICLQHNVLIISDEIHADLVFEGHIHIPFASLGEKYSLNSVTLSSPTKTFNLAGLQVGYFFTENEQFRKAIQSSFQLMGIELLNIFGIAALIAAYEESEQWLDALKEYLQDNYIYLTEFLNLNLPQIKVTPLEATYLVWLDCTAFGKTADELSHILLEEQKLWINSGTMYGASGEGFLRINIATPRVLLQIGLERLLKGLSKV